MYNEKMALNREEICSRINTLVQPVLVSMRLELVEIEFKRSGREAVLRLFIDKEGGVALDDCAELSRELSLLLDIEDFIPCEYNLEVSSPGLDRPLRSADDYRRFSGRQAKLVMREPVDGQKYFKGRLGGVEDGAVVAVLIDAEDGRRHRVPIDVITRANLEVEF